MNHITSRLTTIGSQLSGIAKRAGDLLRESSGLPTAKQARRYTGSTRRLSDDEEDLVVRLLDAGHSVQHIASELAVSRPAIYGVRDRRRPGMHTRSHA